MFMKELTKFYDHLLDCRKIEEPYGFSMQSILFKVVLSKNGEVKQIVDLRENKKGKKIVVPRMPDLDARSSNSHPNFIVDNPQYVFGYKKNDTTGKQDAAIKKKFQDFRERFNKVVKKNN